MVNSNILHLVFELVQNADDVDYPAGLMPELRIDLARPGYILFDCNQCGFTEGNVNSLCAVNKSSKKGNVDTTGEKGLGKSCDDHSDCRLQVHFQGLSDSVDLFERLLFLPGQRRTWHGDADLDRAVRSTLQ